MHMQMITSKSLLPATEPHNNKISGEQEEASDPPIAHNAEGKEALEQEAWESPTQQHEIVQGKEGGRGVGTPHRACKSRQVGGQGGIMQGGRKRP